MFKLNSASGKEVLDGVVVQTKKRNERNEPDGKSAELKALSLRGAVCGVLALFGGAVAANVLLQRLV